MLKPIKQRGSFLSRIIVANVVIFVLSIIVLSVLNYGNNTRIIDQHTSLMYKRLLTQTDYNIEALYERVFQIGEQLLNDTEVVKGLFSNELSPVDSMKVASKLNDVVNANKYINSVYLYNGEKERFIHTIRRDVSIQTIDKEAPALIEVRKQMQKMIFLPHKQSYVYESKAYDNNILSLIFTYSGGNNGYAIFINLELNAILDLFNKMGNSAYSNFIIVDKSGLNIINGSKPDLFLHDTSDQDYIDKVIHAAAKSDHFIGSVDGEKSLVTYVYNDKLEWYLINTTSYSYLAKDNLQVLQNIILISVIILVLSIAATVLLTNKIYTPFGRVVKMIKFSHPAVPAEDNYDDVEYVSDVFKGLIQKVTTLEDSAVKDRNRLRAAFLRDWLNGEGRMDEAELALNFSKLNVQIRPNDLRVLLLVMEGQTESAELEEEQPDLRMNFVADAMVELALRIFTEHGELEKIDTGSHSFVFILNDFDGSNVEAKIGEFVYQVEKLMSFRLKIGVGIRASSMQELSKSYETAKEALNYMFVVSDENVYDYENIQAQIRKQAHYPVKLEQTLINQLKLNDRRASEETVEALFGELKHYAIKDSYATLKQLGSSIDHEFNDIVDFAPLCKRYEQQSLARVIEGLIYFERLHRFFLELVDYIIQDLKSNRYRDSKEIVKNACEYIQQQYRKGDLSADAVAAALNISVPYFSKLFNENMRMTFSAYVTNLRLSEAESLLLHTPLRIKEISENIGFLNSTYFITVFKKKHGVSPNQYRQMKRAN
ncbi:helix-turn-helix domain-containing protein [Paenibacillus sp. FJAT-27812]|uniref:helix-turn-helix domain-containing protein n=1 Tax=Paenibacillus sp. FJAT-27812 TaxID=1684143 RepID=UPI0006A79AE3|nr:helix-turn-helix domain-containing protein [Paenibacillus sp. FJAT-27812]